MHDEVDEYGISTDVLVRGRRGMVALGLFIGELEKEIAIHGGLTLTGYTVSRQPGGWRIVLRADRNGQHLVAFAGGRTLMGLYRNLYYDLYNSILRWRVDRFK